MAGVRSASAILCLVLATSGCAYSIVSEGRIRRDAFDPVLGRTMVVRQIRAEGPVQAEVVSKAELAEILTATLDAQWAPEQIEAYERGLVAIGLWPPEEDLRTQMVAVYSGEVAGVYTPANRTMYIVEDVDPPFSIRMLSAISGRDLWVETTLSHEIIHLLQHQEHPELLDPTVLRLDQDDLDRALQAAIEGDALRYGYASMGVDVSSISPDVVRSSVEEELASSDTLGDAPALLRWTLAFPYVEGYRLSVAEGFGLLESPPASTEQVIHPGRRDEAFQVFDLAALREALPDGCAFVHANTVGELHLSVLFREFGADPVADAAIWQGWDGDRFVAADCDGGLEFLWLTAWDGATDAAEFEAGYRTIAGPLGARAGHAPPPTALRRASEVVVWSSGLADLAPDVFDLARRARVAKVEELRRHFGLPEAAAETGVGAP